MSSSVGNLIKKIFVFKTCFLFNKKSSKSVFYTYCFFFNLLLIFKDKVSFSVDNIQENNYFYS